MPTPEPSTDEGEYQVLRPDLEQDGSADSGMGSGGTGSGDGGFTDPRRYRKPDFPPRNGTRPPRHLLDKRVYTVPHPPTSISASYVNSFNVTYHSTTLNGPIRNNQLFNHSIVRE